MLRRLELRGPLIPDVQAFAYAYAFLAEQLVELAAEQGYGGDDERRYDGDG